MKLFLLSWALALILAGCGGEKFADALSKADQKALRLTSESFKHPKEVGQLPDGRKIFVVEHFLSTGGKDRIYFTDCSVTTKTLGKYSKTSVVLDGENSPSESSPGSPLFQLKYEPLFR